MPPFKFHAEVYRVSNQKAGLVDLFRNKVLRINLLLMMGLWIVVSFVYYLINFYVKYMNGSIFSNNLISICSELSGKIIASIILQKLSLKKFLFMVYCFAGVCALLQALFEGIGNWVVYLSVLVIKLGMGGAFVGVYMGNYDLFPPRYVGASFAACNLFARMATISAPLVAETPKPLPMLIASGLGAFACFCVVGLVKPEKEEEIDPKSSTLLEKDVKPLNVSQST